MADEQPWHSLTEAARLTGLDREAIRSRIRRGVLASRKGNSGGLLVQIPAAMLTGSEPAAGSVAADETAALLTEVRAAVADLTAEIAELREQQAGSTAELQAAKAVAAAKVEAAERIIAELREMLAEARRPWWRRWRG